MQIANLLVDGLRCGADFGGKTLAQLWGHERFRPSQRRRPGRATGLRWARARGAPLPVDRRTIAQTF